MLKFLYEKERIYANDNEGNLLAEVTFPIRDGVAYINHTFVDRSLRGQGVAAKLMVLLSSHLKKENLKAIPTCSYAVEWSRQNPDAFDLV